MTEWEWWTEQVAMAWFAWNDARRALGEIEENEPEMVRIFRHLGFEKELLGDMRATATIFACLGRFKRKAEVDCPGIAEKKAVVLIEKLHTTLRRVWYWIHVMRLGEAIRWTRHGLLFRAELVRQGLMAYDPSEWPEPFPRVYKLRPRATPRRHVPRAPGGSSPSIGPLTPRPPIESLKRRRKR